MSLITTAEFKALMNISGSTYDALLASLIPAVQSQIEAALDRKFDTATYQRWFDSSSTNTVVLPQWPLQKLLFIGQAVRVADLTWASGDYGVEVLSDRISVVNVLTPTDFTFAAYPTLVVMMVKIENATAVRVAIVSGYTTSRCQLLQTGMGTTWYSAARSNARLRLVDGSDRVLELVQSLENTFLMEDLSCYDLMIAWTAGYATADVPAGLKLVTANILADCVAQVANGTIVDPNLKSETISNYSYTRFDADMVGRAVAKFRADLDPWRKTTVVG